MEEIEETGHTPVDVERIQINENHQATCWMNYKEAHEKGEI